MMESRMKENEIIEMHEQKANITEIQTQESELGSVMKIMNEDNIEKSGMTTMDMKARLHPMEISSILIHDSIVALNCLPQSCVHLTRQKKRLSVSIMGKGREEIVNVVQSKREQEQGGGLADKLGNFFRPNKE